MLQLISMHVPKCAGTSFTLALEQAFGPENIYSDYLQIGDPRFPANFDPEGYFSRARRDPYPHLQDKQVVHGHFPIGKYARITGVRRITFLREPVERLISHYYYIRSTPPNNMLREYVIENDLSLMDFAKLPVIRRYYAGLLIRNVDETDLDFVGFTESYQADLQRLSSFLGKPLTHFAVNANTAKGYDERRREVLDDPATLSTLRHLLHDDMRLYERLRSRFVADRTLVDPRLIPLRQSGPVRNLFEALWLWPRLRGGLFDAAHYRANHPAAAESRLPALAHFLLIGRHHGASPSRRFDSVAYRRHYADVAASGMDPLFHYLRHGRREGRFPHS